MTLSSNTPGVHRSDSERLQEAEAHLWALVVWFGGWYDNPYTDRDVQAAARYVNHHLSGEDMTARHREVIANA